jgi:hypothetical protein
MSADCAAGAIAMSDFVAGLIQEFVQEYTLAIVMDRCK